MRVVHEVPLAIRAFDVAVVVAGVHCHSLVDDNTVEGGDAALVFAVHFFVGQVPCEAKPLFELDVTAHLHWAERRHVSEGEPLEMDGKDGRRIKERHALGCSDSLPALLALVGVRALEDLGLGEGKESLVHTGGHAQFQLEVLDGINFVGHCVTGSALDLALHSTSKAPKRVRPPIHRWSRCIHCRVRGQFRPRWQRRLLQSVDDVPQELVAVFLAADMELGPDPRQLSADAVRGHVRVRPQPPGCLSQRLQGAQHAIPLPSPARSAVRLSTDGLGQDLGVDQPLQDRIHVACVAKVHQAATDRAFSAELGQVMDSHGTGGRQVTATLCFFLLPRLSSAPALLLGVPRHLLRPRP
mmetsp:Transcript_13868/g.40625  ORF Transcript_13868/g.40625 Transcript_13868/m.40625 type:complete len:355 (-) Transcript_13868:68-1132(-)